MYAGARTMIMPSQVIDGEVFAISYSACAPDKSEGLGIEDSRAVALATVATIVPRHC